MCDMYKSKYCSLAAQIKMSSFMEWKVDLERSIDLQWDHDFKNQIWTGCCMFLKNASKK